MEDNDAQLQLKKRARRRLIGAVFFVSVAAVVLPLVMDQEPRQPVQDVEIRIPGQDDKPFAPKFAAAPVEKPAEAAPAKPAVQAAPALAERPAASPATAAPTARVIETTRDKNGEKVTETAVVAKPPKEAEKPVKSVDKAADKAAAEKTAADKVAPEKAAAERQKAEEAKRAAAILAGQSAADSAKPAAAAKTGGEQLILIGAFSNEENVRILKSKLGELGIRVYTEPLETPQGRKTRVRAGPFHNREAADKALEKMKKIGVSGVIAGKS